MSQILLVSADNDGGAILSGTTFPFSPFLKFQTAKIECIFPGPAAASDLKEGWNTRETFGCQCCE